MTKAKVLIVEDDPVISSDLKKSLQKIDFEVTDVVKSSDNALKSISKNEPNIIMMDINLGAGGNGIDLARQINKIKKIPVLYLTSFSDEENMEKAFETDPIGYLIKPFKREEVNATIMLALYKLNKLEYENINQDRIYVGFGYYFDIRVRKLYYKSKYIKLGLKERQLLSILVEHKNNLVSPEFLEHRLWTDNIPSNSSLRTLIYRLKVKLGCKLIETSYSNGYKLTEL